MPQRDECWLGCNVRSRGSANAAFKLSLTSRRGEQFFVPAESKCSFLKGMAFRLLVTLALPYLFLCIMCLNLLGTRRRISFPMECILYLLDPKTCALWVGVGLIRPDSVSKCTDLGIFWPRESRLCKKKNLLST